MNMNGARVLVTGAAGFLGSHLTASLLDRGCAEVVGVDDFSTSDSSSKHHIDLLKRKRYLFRRANISEFEALHNAVGDNFDYIFNMACPASPPAYMRMPMHTMMTSVMGVTNCVELARRKNSKIIHASTSEIYGDPQQSPQTERYFGNVNSWGPRSCYDEGKRAAESILWIAKSQGSNVRLARIFNTYGPHMMLGDGRVVTEFIRAILENRPLPIHGDGSQTRSLCFASDLIRGLLALADLKASPAHPVNIGNPREVTIKELGSILQSVTGHTVGFVSLGRPIDDPSNRKPDISAATELLNWSPRVSLEDGLRSTFAWFKNQCE